MPSPFRFAAGLAGLLFTGAVLAAGPVNPPPSSCAWDEVYKCRVVNGQTFCRCVKRDLSIPATGQLPRALKGKPQHLVNLGAGATEDAPQQRPGR